MPKFQDLSNKKFGKWTVVEKAGSYRGSSIYKCVCDCGSIKNVLRPNLISGKTKSCGCGKSEAVALKKITHGQSRKKNQKATKVYTIWSSMLNRCNNKNNSAYKNYGGRGINVCDRWLKFENFLQDMGEPKSNESIDRIDNNKGYFPENCRWATAKIQNRNKSNTKLTEQDVKDLRSKKITVKELAKKRLCSKTTVYSAKTGRNWK